MDRLLMAATDIGDFWYAVPLIIAVSLVYAATRHEQMEPILGHAVRIAAWIAGFMGIVFVVILAVSWLVRCT